MFALTKVRQMSKALGFLTSLVLVGLPVVVVWSLFASLADPYSMANHFPGLPESTVFTPQKTALAGAVGSLMLIPSLFVLWQMRRLFSRYLQGEVLTAHCAGHIRKIGLGFVVLAGAGILLPTVQSLILTHDNPTGQRVLSVAITSDSLGFLLAGGLLTVIGWAMTEAARAAEENAGFI